MAGHCGFTTAGRVRSRHSRRSSSRKPRGKHSPTDRPTEGEESVTAVAASMGRALRLGQRPTQRREADPPAVEILLDPIEVGRAVVVYPAVNEFRLVSDSGCIR